MVINEVTLNSNSVIQKIVIDNTDVIKHGEQYKYEHEPNKFMSKRVEGTKYYFKRLIPDIHKIFPNIVLVNHKVGRYAELVTDESQVVSKEWYIGFTTEEAFKAFYTSLGMVTPSGKFYDLLRSNPDRYKYSGLYDDYKYCASVEVNRVQKIIKVEWYMSFPDDEIDQIIKDFKCLNGL